LRPRRLEVLLLSLHGYAGYRRFKNTPMHIGSQGEN
jgi:hypothetical protein